MVMAEGKQRVQMLSAHAVLFHNVFDLTAEPADGEGGHTLWVSLCRLGMVAGACFSIALPVTNTKSLLKESDKQAAQEPGWSKAIRAGQVGADVRGGGFRDALALGDSCSAPPPRSSPWQPSLAPPATVAFPPHGSLFMTGRMSNCVPRSAARRSLRAAGPPATSSCTRRRSKV